MKTYDFEDMPGKFQRQPLVFLNVCQSAGGPDELRITFNLPKVFSERGQRLLPLPDLFAAAFAKRFYTFFLKEQEFVNEQTGEKVTRQMTIGEALRQTRQYFLENHNNPLGLTYGLYSPAYYRVAQPLFAG